MDDAARPLAEEALKEAQATVRAYDTKAQIVGVGYIFALNVVARIGEQFDAEFEAGAVYVLVSWATLILPAVLFGMVLYPSRRLIAGSARRSVLYIKPGDYKDADAYIEAARNADPLAETARELLKVSELREIKRTRFLRALFAAGVSLVALLLLHLVQASL